ncbi:MAG: penicillin-binding transpeptidase domain-containing protein [marine benthic group bacterium]|nr:penicillin-binding transpeptidase domain-containing protein [Candidatus Benthicola marisminoris]
MKRRKAVAMAATQRRKIAKKTHGRRTHLFAAVLAMLATVFVSRAAQLQIIQGGSWQAQAWSQTTETVELPAPRGAIYDRNGKALALSRQEYRAFFAPAQSADVDRDIQSIASALDLSRKDRQRLRRRSTGWISIGRVGVSQREALVRAVGPGVEFESMVTRVYPEGDLARSVLGALDTEGRGRSGLEGVLDSILTGTPGRLTGRRDAHGELYPIPESPDHPAEPGHDVYLTIDADLQAIAEAALEKGLQRTGSSGGDVLMADPRTGEILAVASRRQGSSGTIPAFTSPYEPGSTVKPFLLATLLSEDLADLDEKVFAENGEYRTPHRVLTDEHPYDSLTVEEVIQYSSNIGAAKLSDRLQPGLQYRYLRDFGFGTPTGIDFPGESGGLLRRPSGWSALSPASLAIGYELMTTSLQQLMAYGALANGGTLMQPALVKEIRSGSETARRFEPRPIRRVLDETSARSVSDVLQTVVGEGTGSEASLVTLRMAGKTGTARIASAGGYDQGRYASSFVGFTPVEDPRLVIMVKLEDPKGEVYGGLTAAPVIRAVVQAVLATQGRGLIEPGSAINPRARLDWAEHGEVSPYRLASTEEVRPASSSRQELRLPDLIGLETRVAVSRLHAIGLRVELAGSGRVANQEPAPGTRVVRGAAILLR